MDEGKSINEFIKNDSLNKKEHLNFDIDLDDISSTINFDEPAKAEKEIKNITDNNNLEEVFKTLSTDIVGANEFIKNLKEEKRIINEEQIKLLNDKQTFLKEKQDFEKLKIVQQEALTSEKKLCDEYINREHKRLSDSEDEFRKSMESSLLELQIEKQTFEMGKKDFENDRTQFEQYRIIEAERIKSEDARLELKTTKITNELQLKANQLKDEIKSLEEQKNQFERYKMLEEEKIKNERSNYEKEIKQKEIELKFLDTKLQQEKIVFVNDKEQFEQYKEISEKKLQLENNDLQQKCDKLKGLISQFNLGFLNNVSDESRGA